MTILPFLTTFGVLAFSPTLIPVITELPWSPSYLGHQGLLSNEHLYATHSQMWAVRSILAKDEHIPLRTGLSVKQLMSDSQDIQSPSELYVSASIHSNSGDIRIESASVVMGSIHTRTGKILLNNVTVAGHVKSQTGDISLRGNTVIYGDVILGYESADHDGSYNQKHTPHSQPSVYIGKNVRIFGALVVDDSVTVVIDDPASLHQVYFNTE